MNYRYKHYMSISHIALIVYMMMVQRLSDSKSLQVSRTLLSILVNLNNAIVQMVSIHLLVYFSPFTSHLVTLPRAPITINITFIF